MAITGLSRVNSRAGLQSQYDAAVKANPEFQNELTRAYIYGNDGALGQQLRAIEARKARQAGGGGMMGMMGNMGSIMSLFQNRGGGGTTSYGGGLGGSGGGGGGNFAPTSK